MSAITALDGQPLTAAPHRAGGWWCWLIVLGVTAGVLLATLPRFLYPGDPQTIRLSAECWLRTGDPSVPESVATQFGERGQYFFQHPHTGKWYPKYGLANTVLYVLPLSLEYVATSRLPPENSLTPAEFAQRRFTLNAFHVVLALLLAGYLFALARRETTRGSLAVGFVLAVLFCTFTWSYLRAHTVEVFQLLSFTAAWQHAVRTHDLADERGRWQHGLAATLWLGGLVLGKLVYAPLLLIVPTYLWTNERQYARRVPWKFWVGQGAILGLIVAVALWANWYRFGSVWDTGYGQWTAEQHFLQGNPLEALTGYAVDSRTSVFLYFPPLALAVLGWPFVVRDRRREALFAGLAFLTILAVNANFVNWRGEWCYGPRYLLFGLPVVSLPAIAFLDRGLQSVPKLARAVCRMTVVVGLLWSLQWQMRVNLLDFLMPARIAGHFESVADEAVTTYFWRQPYWQINTDLVWFAIGRGPFPPLDHLRGSLTEAQQEHLAAEIRRAVTLNLRWVERETRAN